MKEDRQYLEELAGKIEHLERQATGTVRRMVRELDVTLHEAATVVRYDPEMWYALLREVASLSKRVKELEQEVEELRKEIAEQDNMLDDWRYHPYIPEDSP